MKYAFSSITYGSGGSWVPAYSLDETIRRVAGIGYDALDIVTASPHAWPDYLDAQKRAHYRSELAAHALGVSGIFPFMAGCAGYNVATENDKERMWTANYLKKCVDLAKDWDAGSIAYLPGWTLYGCDKRKAWALSVEVLRDVAAYANGQGIRVLIQQPLSQSNVVDCPMDARYMMEEVGLPNVGLMFDVLSAVNRKADPADYVYETGTALQKIHVCDYGRQIPGTQGLDFRQLFIALKDIGYDGPVVVEVDSSRSVHADSFARRSLEYLKNIEAGV